MTRTVTPPPPSAPPPSPEGPNLPDPVRVWGLPLAPITQAQAVDTVAALVRAGRPSYFITASTHYAMLTAEQERLRGVNDAAAFVVADGAPLVWASRLAGTPLPERVAGSDLIYSLCERSAREGFRVFLLGAAEGVADRAAARLVERYPGLVVAGTECPPFQGMTPEENAALVARVRDARPDLLFVAFGQPKGEYWIVENLGALGVPVCVQIGASLDFVAGRVPRAPRVFQRVGLEWFFRMCLEPRRLAPRYARNGRFVAGRVARDLLAAIRPGRNGRALG